MGHSHDEYHFEEDSLGVAEVPREPVSTTMLKLGPCSTPLRPLKEFLKEDLIAQLPSIRFGLLVWWLDVVRGFPIYPQTKPPTGPEERNRTIGLGQRNPNLRGPPLLSGKFRDLLFEWPGPTKSKRYVCYLLKTVCPKRGTSNFGNEFICQ